MKLIAPFGILEWTKTGLMALPRSPLYGPNDDLERDGGDLVDASTLQSGLLRYSSSLLNIPCSYGTFLDERRGPGSSSDQNQPTKGNGQMRQTLDYYP
jgi:hypothetical protein